MKSLCGTCLLVGHFPNIFNLFGLSRSHRYLYFVCGLHSPKQFDETTKHGITISMTLTYLSLMITL